MVCLGSCGVLLCRAPAAEPSGDLEASLVSPSYPERVRGEERLRAWAAAHGEGAMRWLVIEAFEHREPEARMRIMDVLRTTVLDRLEQERPGFLGITMRADRVAYRSERWLAVQVTSVQDGSPAYRAGVIEGDRILKLDGRKWTESDSSAELAERIGSCPPGREVTLEILRGNETREVRVVLGPRPWSAGIWGEPGNPFQQPFSRGESSRELEKKARDEVFADWLKAFRAGLPEHGQSRPLD
jgi:hypothetical protein